MTHLIFLDMHCDCCGPMAQGFARQLAPPDVKITNIGFESQGLDPKAVEVMNEIGIDIASHASEHSSIFDISMADVVVALSQEAVKHCTILPGRALVVSWDIPYPPRNDKATLDDYRKVRDLLKHRIENFFAGGYLTTLTAQKHSTEVLLDNFTEGIIIHDNKRIISWFNRAAEKITGFDRQDVIGRDCFDVYPGGLCGGKCLFREEIPNLEKINYPLVITTRDGSHKRVEMVMSSLKNDQGVLQGVLACFHDVTEVTLLRKTLKTVQSFHGLIGADDKMQDIYELIGDLASSDCAVLIQGESGTGKELVAGAIHGEGVRAGKPFVTVNCGALPEGILESELFGHVRGAFTGAIRDKKGRFELAHHGTIFLDEVAELSHNMQVKLLRVLQDGTFERVGGEKQVKVDVRVISATNKNLRDMVKEGKFREDLFYRLCVVPIDIPPLRQRRHDIPLIINNVIDRLKRETGRSLSSLAPEALDRMVDYDWPGNVRELQNAIQYTFVKCKEDVIELEHLPPEILSHTSASGSPTKTRHRRGKLSLDQVNEALKKTGGNKVKAAQLLGVGRATLHRFIKAHDRQIP